MIFENEVKLLELENLRLKRTYNKDNLAIEYDFDNALLDGTALEYIKVSSFIIQRKNEKVKALKRSLSEMEKKLDAINKKYSVTINRDKIEEQIKNKEEEEKIRKLRKDSIDKKDKEEQIELGTLKKLSKQEEDGVNAKYDDYKNKVNTYSEKESTFLKAYPDIDKISLFNKKYTPLQLENLKTQLDEAEKDYITEYKTIAQHFEETKEGKDPLVKEQLDNKTFEFTILERTLLGSRISHLDKITPYLEGANTERMRMMGALHETMMKVFSTTASKYKSFEGIVKNLNTFFKGKKISNHYYFKVNFEPNSNFSIDWIEQLKSHGRQVFRQGELPLGESVETFIESFFNKATGNTKKIHLVDLLNPKTYFTLSVKLTDENNIEISGSTGETYSSILLLGIGRLSKVQEENRAGIRFMILEETANLDPTNFNTFPNIAEEFGYQLITMTPRPYGSDEGKEWYVHHLIKGNKNPDINYQVVGSYYRTNDRKEDLVTYLQAKEVA